VIVRARSRERLSAAPLWQRLAAGLAALFAAGGPAGHWILVGVGVF
jgi:hypothetical protein